MLRKPAEPRPLIWRGSSKTDYMAFPAAVQREMGYALFLAQAGERHPAMAKTLKGFSGGKVVEVKENHDGNATGRFIRYAMPMQSTCFTRSRRNRRRAPRLRRQT